MKKLTIVNGIIQDKFIDDIPIRIQIVEPKGKANVRTLIKMTECIGITNHNTGNNSPTTGDELHANWMQNVENADLQYVSAHLYVDQDSITQIIPLDEVTFNAGDGKGRGNYKTISIEICENANVDKAEENAKKLNASLILTYSNLKIYKHQDWSGKYCPRVILNKNGWSKFVEDILNYVRIANMKLTEVKEEVKVIYTTLRLGLKGNDVLLLQTKLKSLNYKIQFADGIFGNETLEAVKEFQKNEKLYIDGIFGAMSWKALETVKALVIEVVKPVETKPVTPVTPVFAMPTLKLGSKGEDVKTLQSKLKNLNYIISVDGDFGVGTDKIVKQFQTDNGLVADGIVGKGTYGALKVAKAIVKLTPILDTPISKYEITKTKDGINIVKIKKSCIKNIDVILCKQPKETLKNLYTRLAKKPTFLINGGLFAMNNGNSMSSMFDEEKKIVSGYFSDFGLYVKKDGSYGFDNFNNVKDIRDFIGASPTLIVNGIKNVDLKGLTKDKAFTDSRHPRTCIGMDANYFYLIIIDGRQLGKKGMTVNELVDFGLKMKLKFMINLDGGYSSLILDANGKSVNSQSENRAIDNAIAFYL